MKKIIFRIFKFDAKRDYEFYLKPYEISKEDILDTFTLFDILKIIKEQDMYFNLPKTTNYVRIENKIISLNTNALELINSFGDDISIYAISEKRAYLDLDINEDDFLDKFKYFKNLCDESDYELYKTYNFLYYASNCIEFNENYLGDSAFIFAKKMCEKYPQKEKEFLEIIKNKEGGIEYAFNLEPFLFKDANKYEDIKNELKQKALQ